MVALRKRTARRHLHRYLLVTTVRDVSLPLPPDPSLSPRVHASAVSGRIEIVLIRGHRVIVDSGVDTAALERVLAVLERP